MANLIYAISASLDGYIVDENGNFDWTQPSEDAHAFFNDLQRSVGTMLCGRRMYETMRVWDTMLLDDLPEVPREFAEAWRATEKIVYSSTLDAVPEPRTRLERTFEPEAVQTMKDKADRDLSIAGAGLAAQAIRAGLVDRYLMRLVPTIVGGGTSALPDAARVDLTLNTTRRFDDGSVLLDYGLRRARRTEVAATRRNSDRVAGMRTHDYLKARLRYVRQDFDEVLENLIDADLRWRPADDMPSIAGLLIEIANKEKELIAWLQSGEWPDDDPDAFAETATLTEMRSVLATLREQTLRHIDSFDEAGLEELVPCPEKWWEALRLEACPRSEILRNLAAHEWYHTGQLIVYQSMRGVNPDDR